MHDRLGVEPCCVILREDGFLCMSGWKMANDRVLDEQPDRRDPVREPYRDNIDLPQWCPASLTRSQKRRVQRLRQTEALEEERKEAPRRGVRSEVWRVKQRADDKHESGSSVAPVNMITMLPPIQAVGFPNHP